VPDVVMTGPVQDNLEAAGLAPGEHDVDSGYVSAALLVSSRQRGITLLGPLLAGTSPQARTGGYTAAMFAVDFDRKQATCPEGAVSSKWKPMRQHDGKEAISVRFATAACRGCPARDKCTTATWAGRQLFLRPREIHEAAAAARAGQETRQWQDRYKARAGVEGTMAQAAHVTGIRRARYPGLDKTRLEHLAAATAINVIRLDAWYTGRPLDRTRTTHLQRLDLTPARHEPELGSRISMGRKPNESGSMLAAHDQPRPGDPPKILSQPAGVAPDLGQRNRVYLVTAVLPTRQLKTMPIEWARWETRESGSYLLARGEDPVQVLNVRSWPGIR
jgi:Transposase DDE domain